jgi:hypothetical protein
LFAGLLKILIAAKKLVIIGAIGIGALVTGWIRRRRGGGEACRRPRGHVDFPGRVV